MWLFLPLLIGDIGPWILLAVLHVSLSLSSVLDLLILSLSLLYLGKSRFLQKLRLVYRLPFFALGSLDKSDFAAARGEGPVSSHLHTGVLYQVDSGS